MKLYLYNNNSPEIKAVKNLQNEAEFDGTFKNEENIENPIVLLSVNPINYNYCVIPSLSRNYFIRSVNLLRTGVYELILEEDYISSHYSGIIANSAILNRTEDSNFTNTYLPDNLQNVYANKKTAIKNFTGASFEYSSSDSGYFQIVLGTVGSG